MNIDLVTTSRIAVVLDAFEPAIAEHIRAQAHESADLAIANGWDPAGDAYDIAGMPGDAQALADRLGTRMRDIAREIRALELCVRHLMAYAAEH